MVTKNSSYYQRYSGWVIDSVLGFPKPEWKRGLDTYVSLSNFVTYGGNVPGYRRLISRGDSATTGLSGRKTWLKVTPTYAYMTARYVPTNQLSTYGRFGEFYSAPVAPSGSIGYDSKTRNRALRSFFSAARSAQTAISGGVVLGEIRETLHMIRNPAYALRQGIGDYVSEARKRAKGRKRRTVPNMLSDLWLEKQFGWGPLMSDIRSGCDLLVRMNAPRIDLTPVRGFGQNAQLISSSLQNPGSQGGLTWRWDVRNYYTYMCIVRGAVRTSVPGPRYMDTRLYGFDLSNFAPTVWELIPYSFLVDYFSNIGEILNAWSFVKSSLSWYNMTQIADINRDVYSVQPGVVIGSNERLESHSFTPGTTRGVQRIVERSIPSSLIPDLEFGLPEFRSTKWLNLAALLGSRYL